MEKPLKTKTTTLTFWKEYWYVAVGILIFVLLIISQVVRILTPTVVPIQENSWKEVTPGYSSLDQVTEKLGPPLTSEPTNLGTALYYQSDFPVYPNEVIIDQTNTVQFIKEYIVYDPNHLLSQYIEQFGQPDLELFTEETGSARQANVFLTKGLVIISHISGGTVEQKWYFTPTTKDVFMRSWGNTLTDKDEGHGFAP